MQQHNGYWISGTARTTTHSIYCADGTDRTYAVLQGLHDLRRRRFRENKAEIDNLRWRLSIARKLVRT
jgi:hypothetical protein